MQTALAVGGLVLVALLVYAFTRQTVEDVKDEDDLAIPEITKVVETPSTTADTGDVKANTAKPVVKKPVIKTAQPIQNYQKALETYPYKLQFVNCASLPAKLTFKQGVRVMLDNRDPKAHVIAFGKNKYTVNAYDFTIITAPVANAYITTCDGRTVGQIEVQK